MDPNTRDESRDRRREEALARLLGEALDRAAPQGAEQCPDAELIAAYHERALGPEEAAQCEIHFAACSRCRKILAVLAASADTPLAEKEVARLGELVAAARAPHEAASQTAKPGRPNRLDWRARWLAPALGVAAVLAVWFTLRPPWRTTDQSSSGTIIAQAPKNEPPQNTGVPALDSFSRIEPKKNVEKGSALSKDQPSAKPPSSKLAVEAPSNNRVTESGRRETPPSDAVADNNGTGNEKKEKTEAAGRATGGLAPPSPVPAPLVSAPRAQAEVQEMSRPAPPEPRAAANSPARALIAPSARAATSSKSAAADKSIATFSAPSGASVAGLLKSPSGAVSWRIGVNGRIERSTDAGRTWILQASPSQEEWQAGVAVSDTICWIVGRNGSIARTTDGEHWEKIAPPSLSAAASRQFTDWINVMASDAQTATITSSDQHRYATQDGGMTWRAQ
jgi:hypothetical protein